MPYVPVEIDKRRKGSHVKTAWLRLRVSKVELERYKRYAAERGISMSEMIRSAIDGVDNEKSV